MARNMGPMDFDGTVGELTFYRLKGVRRVKRKSHVSKKKIKTSPRSQGTRDMNMEFGGASKVTTAIRRSLVMMEKEFGESYLSGALTGRLRAMVSMGEGERGKRVVDLRQHGHNLVGFEFDRLKPLGYSMGLNLLDVQLNATRDLVTWNVPTFDPQGLVTAPSGATHFRFVLAAGQVSNYYYKPSLKGYAPAVIVDKVGTHFYGEPQALNLPLVGPLHMELPVMGILPNPDEVAVVMTAGIQFLELVNGAYYPFEERAAMQIVGVN